MRSNNNRSTLYDSLMMGEQVPESLAKELIEFFRPLGELTVWKKGNSNLLACRMWSRTPGGTPDAMFNFTLRFRLERLIHGDELVFVVILSGSEELKGFSEGVAKIFNTWMLSTLTSPVPQSEQYWAAACGGEHGIRLFGPFNHQEAIDYASAHSGIAMPLHPKES